MDTRDNYSIIVFIEMYIGDCCRAWIVAYCLGALALPQLHIEPHIGYLLKDGRLHGASFQVSSMGECNGGIVGYV